MSQGGPGQRPRDALVFFRDRFGLGPSDLENALETTLERQVDYADLYFEYTVQDSVALEEGIVKSGSRHLEQGVGVRAVRGEKQGYAHSDDISVESVTPGGRHRPRHRRTLPAPSRDRHARPRTPRARPLPRRVRPAPTPGGDKVALLERDRRVRTRTRPEGQAGDGERRLAAPADPGRGQRRHARRRRAAPRATQRARSWPKTASRREVGFQAMGGRFELERLMRPRRLEAARRRSRATRSREPRGRALPRRHLRRRARPGLAGHPAARGHRPWPRRRLQPQADVGLLGTPRRTRRVAEGVTVVDDGTLPGRRGSINVDDEGTPEPTHHPDRGRRARRLHAGSAERAAHGHGAYRQRTPRELRPSAHAAHDQHVHARRREDARGHPEFGQERPLRRLLRRRPGRHHERQVRLQRQRGLQDRRRTHRRPGQGRDADRQRPGRADPGIPHRPRPRARSRASAPAARTASACPSASGLPTIRVDELTVGGTEG